MVAPKKERLEKDDGRYIIFYEFEPEETEEAGKREEAGASRGSGSESP